MLADPGRNYNYRLLQLAGLAIALALPSITVGQTLQPELRIDALGPPPFTVEPGVGLNLFLGNYVRAGADVGFNVRRHPTFTGGSWRGDLLARVTLDPFRQQRWGFSLGGGLSLRPHIVRLAAVVDLEGPQVGAVLPALQLGVSGGVRAGLILRRAVPRRR